MMRNKYQKLKIVGVKSAKNYIMVGCCALLAATAIFLTIETATNGVKFAELQKKESELLAKKQELEQELVKTLSVNTLQEQSSSLGLVRIDNLVYVGIADGVANTEPVAKLPF